MMTHAIELTVKKLPVDMRIMGVVQNQVYDSVIKYMRDSFGIDKKLFKKHEQETKQECSFIIRGTKDECEAERLKIESLPHTIVQNFVNKFKDNRLIPKKIREKMNKIQLQEDITAYTFLQTYLGYFNIIITVDVKEIGGA
jgi:hypothetical protein